MVRRAKWFSLMVDEASDCQRKEWMSFFVCIRDYDCIVDAVEVEVAQKKAVKEVCLGLSTLENATSETLFNTINDRIKEWVLDWNNCIGQSYDGASNMSGHLRGLRARVQEEAPQAIYVHCCGHNLQLCLIATAQLKPDGNLSIPCMCELFETFRELYNFIGASPQRSEVFRKKQLEYGISTSNIRKLVELSDTRWACRVKALDAVRATYKPLLQTLRSIEDGERISALHRK